MFRLADKYRELEQHLQSFVGKFQDTKRVLEFATCLANIATKSKLSTIQGGALLDSLRHMEGHTFDVAALRRNGRRVLANWSFIRDGVEIPVWTGGNLECDVLFGGVQRVPVSPNDRPKYLVEIHLKSGLGAGIISCAYLYGGAIKRFLAHDAGCRKFNCTPEEISGMTAKLVVQRRNDILHVNSWNCTQQQKEHNRELCLFRRRADRCKRQGPCRDCPKNINQCSLAVWLPPKEEING